MVKFGDQIKKLRKSIANYIAPSKEDLKIGKKEMVLVANDTPIPENKDSMGRLRELTLVECRKTAQQCPLFMKGARKKAADSIRAWHEIETYDKKKNVPAIDLNIISRFEKRNNLKLKWLEARVASYIYGDGYLLITYDKDDKTALHDPPADGAIPWKVTILNSEHITAIDYYPERKIYYKKRATKHFFYENKENMEEKWIHPDRIIHFVCDKLPHKEFGTSKVNLLRNIIKSMINVDIACGEILAWFAHAMLDVKQDNMEEPDRKKWTEICNKHPGAYIHDETAELKSIQPEAIDPKPFYDYLILKVAATFQMPTHILTGIQVGKVTGAEVGTGDYVKDVKDDQDLQYTPQLEWLYSKLLESKNRKWKYDIVWNPIYIDELAEAEILIKRVEAAEKALNGARGAGGFINLKESREIFNRGQIILDEKVPSDLRKPMVASPKTSKGEDESESDGEQNTQKEKNLYEHQLDIASKAMIKKREEQSKKEKDLGKQILEEQEDNDNNKD